MLELFRDIRTVISALLCLLCTFIWGSDLIKKRDWQEKPAQVVAIRAECWMETSERKIVFKTITRTEIPCETVAAFKALQREHGWKVGRTFHGTLRVGSGANVVQAPMDLPMSKGHEPQVGSRLTVTQNPADPFEIAMPGWPGLMRPLTLGVLIFGCYSLYAVYGRLRVRLSSSAVKANTERRTDALIGEALAEQDAAAPTRSPFYPAPRTDFGRRNR